jgi:hypothetical protein
MPTQTPAPPERQLEEPPLPRRRFFCPHCNRKYTGSGLGKHLSQSKKCSRLEKQRILSTQNALLSGNPKPAQIASSGTDNTTFQDIAMESFEVNNHIEWQNLLVNDPLLDAEDQPLQSERAQDFDVTDTGHAPELEAFASSSGRAVEHLHTTPYPDDLAGHKFERADTIFETWRKKELEGAGSVFDDPHTWETAHWLMTSGLSNSARDKFFKLKVSTDLKEF